MATRALCLLCGAVLLVQGSAQDRLKENVTLEFLARRLPTCGSVSGASDTSGSMWGTGLSNFQDGQLTNPAWSSSSGRDYVFQNVPSYLQNGPYVYSSTNPWPGAGATGSWTWNIDYTPPVLIYVFEGANRDSGVAAAADAGGWTKLDSAGFQRAAGAQSSTIVALNVWRKYMSTGTQITMTLSGTLVGGVGSSVACDEPTTTRTTVTATTTSTTTTTTTSTTSTVTVTTITRTTTSATSTTTTTLTETASTTLTSTTVTITVTSVTNTATSSATTTTVTSTTTTTTTRAIEMSDVCFYSKLSLSLGSASQVSSVVEAYASNPTEVSFHLGVGLAQGMDVPPETLSVIAVRTPDVYREVPIVCSDLVPQTSTRRLEETPEWRELQSSSSTLVIDFGVILSAEVANETGATAEGAGHIPLPNVTLFEQTMGDAFTNLNITVEILEVVQETPVLVGYSTTRTTTSMAAIEEDTSLVLILGMSATILIVSAVLISLRWQYLQQYAQLQETQPPLDTAQVDEKEEEVMNSIDTTASPSTVVGVTPVQVTGDPPLEKVYEELEISV